MILSGKSREPRKAEGAASAPANIALCKYWGKRNEELNLPVTSSLSVSLGELGTRTRIQPAGASDEVSLNGERVSPRDPFARGVTKYLDLIRPNPLMGFRVETHNSIPTAAGLASSASGFAALALALDDLFGWALPRREISILARMGSGSAARSVYDGFVEWHAGAKPDGMDSFAEPFPHAWMNLRIGLLTVSAARKTIGSRDAMKRTKRTSALYQSWPAKVEQDLITIKEAISEGNFELLGATAESNALTMHATSLGAWPPVLFWLPESVALMHKIWALRDAGLAIYFTMDAGPNIKLLFLAEDETSVRERFEPIQVVAPFR